MRYMFYLTADKNAYTCFEWCEFYALNKSIVAVQIN